MPELNYDYWEKNKNNHRAYLLNGCGYVETIFIWDNPNYEFVSGDVFSCGSHDRNYNISTEYIGNKDINHIEKEMSDLLNEELYTFNADYMFKQYVKHDGDTHIWFEPQTSWDSKKEYKELYFGSVDYQDWIRIPLFVQSIARHIHNNKLIFEDDKYIQGLKDIVMNQWGKKWNIVIYHDSKVEVI